MEHDYSLAHLTVLSLTPPQVIDVAARAGYRYASLRITQVTPSDPLYDLARDRVLMKETKARLDDTGVEVLDVELFRMDPTLGPDDFVRELEAAAELGARNIIVQLPDPDRERALARYVRLCELARPLGIFASLEFPHWTETANLAEAARIVRVANQANAAILVDMLHMGRSNSSCDELKKLPREWFRFAHVCDAEQQVPRTKQGMIRTAREERLFPGEGTIDVRGILECLPPAIPYSLEIPRVTLTKAIGPEEVARLALVVSKSHLRRSGRESGARVGGLQASPAAVASGSAKGD